MAQRHLDRLSSTDASFLHQEGPASHMHIGGVLVFEGPPPDFEAYLDHVRSRLHLVPRYRQKLAKPPLESGRPLWVDDPDFNLEFHVRHSALPAPGTEEQLLRLAARINSQQLDRAKPLWESWMVEGLAPLSSGEPERFALVFKTHHALVDGVSGVDLATVLFDAEPDPPPERTAGGGTLEPWRPRPEPSPVELILAGLRGAVNVTGEIAGRAAGALDPAGQLVRARAGRPGGRRGDRVGRVEPGAADPAERRDRTAPPLHRRPRPAERPQGGQGRARRNRQRCGADGGGRGAGQVAALPGDPHRGSRAPGARAGLGAHRTTSAARSATS